MKSIVVFCASSTGKQEAYTEAARSVGRMLAAQHIRLVYGGGRVGLMGVVADTVMQEGGEVIGVIPRFLATKEIAHTGLTELIVVESMHERKLKMSELCDGVITLPGGFGTMEELTEMLTWSQLQLHEKPIGILNVNGYYNFLKQLFDQMVAEELLKPNNRSLAIFETDPEVLLQKMRNLSSPSTQNQLQKDKT